MALSSFPAALPLLICGHADADPASDSQSGRPAELMKMHAVLMGGKGPAMLLETAR